MENKYAQKLIEKIQKEILQDKFELASIITDLKKIREYSLEEQNPVVTKSLRLAYEHLENNNAFLIGIPDDEPLESESESTKNVSEENDIESFEYFLSILFDLTKKNNLLDLKEYNKAFLAF
ncbi:hypothetical protein SY27_03340 [Flavobacterium sp. 316]|uniref:Uncharacterized protein n=1 Tax=Flavobacterium sediminilitoris TaxID=2024526 RepID=A0ABY4HLY0_9FLAO|nr:MULTISPECIES: hypothetical protein [Flavobacterium]KIX22861.1 hypothetical protein SY27_03340 [Flavobacterium sp. 316]UOX33232.1 hypothetical protein LXD69_14440 [Flavobacterium sediminilitoris]